MYIFNVQGSYTFKTINQWDNFMIFSNADAQTYFEGSSAVALVTLKSFLFMAQYVYRLTSVVLWSFNFLFR